MGNRNKYTAEQMIDALRKTRGMKGPAAKILNCTYNTVSSYADRYPTVAAVIAEEREMMTDVAELALARAIQGGEAWAVCFYLKTIGKERGYVERQEVTGKNGGAVTLKVVYDEPDG